MSFPPSDLNTTCRLCRPLKRVLDGVDSGLWTVDRVVLSPISSAYCRSHRFMTLSTP